jgi:hypothetical protein
MHCTRPLLSVCIHVPFEPQNNTHPLLTARICNETFDIFARQVQNLIKNKPNMPHITPPRLVQQGFRDGKTPRKTIIRLYFLNKPELVVAMVVIFNEAATFDNYN